MSFSTVINRFNYILGNLLSYFEKISFIFLLLYLQNNNSKIAIYSLATLSVMTSISAIIDSFNYDSAKIWLNSYFDKLDSGVKQSVNKDYTNYTISLALRFFYVACFIEVIIYSVLLLPLFGIIIPYYVVLLFIIVNVWHNISVLLNKNKASK